MWKKAANDLKIFPYVSKEELEGLKRKIKKTEKARKKDKGVKRWQARKSQDVFLHSQDVSDWTSLYSSKISIILRAQNLNPEIPFEKLDEPSKIEWFLESGITKDVSLNTMSPYPHFTLVSLTMIIKPNKFSFSKLFLDSRRLIRKRDPALRINKKEVLQWY